MTFRAQEESRYRRQPVALLAFRYGTRIYTDNSGPQAIFGYTNAEQPVSFTHPTTGPVIYQPIPLEVPKVNQSGTLDRKNLVIRLPDNLPLMARLRKWPRDFPIILTIFIRHLTDPDDETLVVWSGRVMGTNFIRKENVAEIDCMPISVMFQKPGLRRHYQYMCPHVLYSRECGAPRVPLTLYSFGVGPDYIDAPGGWSAVPRKYIGGYADWNVTDGRQIRTIIEVEDDTRIYFNGPTDGLADYGRIRLSLGCNHLFIYSGEGRGIDPDTDCFTLHRNIQNFGGFPFIPKQNPVGTASGVF